MQRIFRIVAVGFGLAALSCGDSDPVAPKPQGTLEVYIYYQDQGLEGKRVELLELALETATDADGLAHFTVLTGDYTLRAYDINRGGPCCAYWDYEVSVDSGKTTRLEIFDCLSCD